VHDLAVSAQQNQRNPQELQNQNRKAKQVADRAQIDNSLDKIHCGGRVD